MSAILTVINKNALYKELIAEHGSNSFTYLRVSLALDGDLNAGTMTPAEKKQIIQVLEEAVKQAKLNIKKS